MYKIIMIDEKEYKLEYSIEASLYSDCIEKLITFMSSSFGAASEPPEGLSEEQIFAFRKAGIKESLSGFANIPSTALTLLYAGLMEHHGVDGDGTVNSLKDAKRLLKLYLTEHDEDGTGSYFDLLHLLMEQMGEDGFLERIGLNKMIEVGNQTEEQTVKPNRETRRSSKKVSEK